jgi:hypothetical protein
VSGDAVACRQLRERWRGHVGHLDG